MPGMRRREFVTLLGGAGGGVAASGAGAADAMPVIGFLHTDLQNTFADVIRADFARA